MSAVVEKERNNEGFETNKRFVAAGLSLLPGLGQIYNRQYVKGIVLIVLTLTYFAVFYQLLDIGLWGIVTLGEELPRDHSIFLMVKGIIALIVCFFGLLIYGLNVKDAYVNGRKRDAGLPLATVRGQYRHLIDYGFPYLLVTPGFVLLVFVVILPIIFVVLISFTNYNLYNSPPANLVDWVGFQNFIDIFRLEVWRGTFIDVFSWTLIWTFTATTLQIALGIFLAVLMNQKDIVGKRVIRTIFILPWAIPAFVSILVFSGMFNVSFGAINQDILVPLGFDPIPWQTNPFWTKIALIMIQTWLGFPFIFAMVTGVLQAIPNELYEAATVDGANILQKFRHITLPLILFATAPILITQYTFNFNNFNVIFLFNGGGPPVAGQDAGSTDILISWIYSLTLESAQYAKAAAITMLLSLVVCGVALWQFRRTRSFKEEEWI